MLDRNLIGNILKTQDKGEPGPRMLLVVMPWAPPQFPCLGAALIRSILVRDGVPCDLLYGNLVYSQLIQSDPIIERQLSKVPMCEATFTPYYFGTPKAETAGKIRDYILPLALKASEHPVDRFEAMIDHAGDCLDAIVEGVPWERYDIVGFSIMMQQTVPSLALARRIREVNPDIRIVFGGANMAAPMGEAILRAYPDVDYIVEGEADDIVTSLVRKIRAGEPPDPVVGGVIWRDRSGEVRRTGESRPFNDLDSLPVPDFDPFFAHVDAMGLDHIAPFLPFESSRGCWWGEKHHCTFCCIGDDVLVFRTKSSERVLEEILTLSARHQLVDLFAVDSIINRNFHRTLLPTLAELRELHDLDISFFFECKSNISRDNALMFKQGGVSAVQPGIESFSDHILKLMDKGATAARQVHCLRVLAENRIGASWNLIFQIPFETEDDYREMLEAMPSLHHLPPLHAEGLIPMQINRFAPYHNTPDAYGIENVQPKEYYATVFPDDRVDLEKLAFYFDCDRPSWRTETLDDLYEELREALKTWQRRFRVNSLIQRRGPGFVRIIDRRAGPNGDAPAEPVCADLVGLDHDIFVACDTPRTVDEMVRRFGPLHGEAQVRARLDRMVAARIMFRSRSGQILSLPLLAEGRAQPADAASEPATRKAAAPERVA